MKSQNTTSQESQHWYTKDGKACHTQPTKKGAKNPFRPTNIKDAKALGLLPSVSAYTKMLAAPGLERWKMAKVAETCFANPPHPGEDMDGYIRNMLEKSKEDGKGAADLGTLIHASIEALLDGNEYENKVVEYGEGQSCLLSDMVDPAFAKIGELDITIESTETVLVNQAEGYAGTTDVAHRSSRGKGILDWKSKRTKKDEPIYPSETHPMQIAAYFVAAFNDSQFDDPYCMNVYISTTEPGRVDVVRYDRDTLVEAYKDFLCLTRLWRSQNNYDPRSL
jgi:hypothetical protein